MKKIVLRRISGFIALFGIALVLILTGCPPEPEKEQTKKDPKITSVTLELASDSGAAFAGIGGEYNLVLTVVGENIFPLVLGEDPNVVFSVIVNNNPTYMTGADITGRVTASGAQTPFTMAVNNFFADRPKDVVIIASVYGTYSERITLEVKPSDLTGNITLKFNSLTQTLTADTSTLPGAGSDTFQWQRSTSADGSFSDITGANASSYVMQEEDFDNYYIRVNVKRTGFTDVWLSSEVYGLPEDAPAITGQGIALTVSGTAAFGETLTAHVSGLPFGTTPVYHWLRGTGDGFEFIQGANSNTYDVSVKDGGSEIKVSIRIEGYKNRLYSLSTDLIPKAVANYITDLYKMHDDGSLPSNFIIQMNYQDEMIEPQDLYFDDFEIEITLKGMPSILNLDVTNYGMGPMFAIVEGVTLVLEDVTLIGIEENYYPLIDIIYGNLIMKNGSEIKDNANYNAQDFSYMGGGINNFYGTVIVDGGSITGNHSYHGGGVMNFGDLIFKNGVISGNSANFEDYGEGGGVFNFEEAIFIMEGGEISGNYARFGGGVVNDDTFIMTGGAISSNVSTDPGEYETSGGVDNLYQFVMQEGTIHGNDAPLGLGNIGNYASLYNKNILATGVYSGTDYANLAAANFTIKYRFYLSTDYTLEVADGEFTNPVAATGITVTGIDPEFYGKTVELSYYNYDDYYRLWGWDKYSEPVTISDSTEILFCFKAGGVYYPTAIPVGKNILRLDIIDDGEIVTRYEQEIPLELGSTTVAIDDFDETCYAVTITDLPAEFVDNEWDMDLYYLLEGGEMRLGTAKRPIKSTSVKIVFPWIVGLTLGDEHPVKLAFEEYVNSSYVERLSHVFTILIDHGNTHISYNDINKDQANGRILPPGNTRMSSLKPVNRQGMGFQNKTNLSAPRQRQMQTLELIKQSPALNLLRQKAGGVYTKEKNIGIGQPRDRRLQNKR